MLYSCCVSDPVNVVDYGVITHTALAHQFEMNTSQSVFLVRMLNDTLVSTTTLLVLIILHPRLAQCCDHVSVKVDTCEVRSD